MSKVLIPGNTIFSEWPGSLSQVDDDTILRWWWCPT